MTANAGRFGFVQPDWARPAGREARAVALGVRLHLLTPPDQSRGSTVARSSGGSGPGEVGQRAPRQRDAGLGGLARQACGDPGAGAGDRPLRGDDHVHVVHRRARRAAIAARASARVPPARRWRARGSPGCDHSATGPSTRRSRGTSCARPQRRGPGPVHLGRVGGGRRGPRQGQRHPGGRRRASRPRAARASAQSRTAIPAGGRGGVGHRAVGDPRAQRGGDAGRRSARRRRGSCRRPARRGAMRTLRSSSSSDHDRAGARVAGPGRRAARGGQHGQQRLGDLAQVGDVDPGRAQALQQAGRNRRTGRPSCGRAPDSAGPRSAVGQPGRARTPASSAALSRTGSTSVVPAGGQPHPGGGRGPDGVAGGGDVQLGEHVLEVDGGHRVHRPAGERGPHRRGELRRARPRRSQCGTRTSEPGSPAGSALIGRRPGGAAPGPGATGPRLRCGGSGGAASRPGYRQRPDLDGPVRDDEFRPISHRSRPAPRHRRAGPRRAPLTAGQWPTEVPSDDPRSSSRSVRGSGSGLSVGELGEPVP